MYFADFDEGSTAGLKLTEICLEAACAFVMPEAEAVPGRPC